jgi:hypothetical protein
MRFSFHEKIFSAFESISNFSKKKTIGRKKKFLVFLKDEIREIRIYDSEISILKKFDRNFFFSLSKFERYINILIRNLTEKMHDSKIRRMMNMKEGKNFFEIVEKRNRRNYFLRFELENSKKNDSEHFFSIRKIIVKTNNKTAILRKNSSRFFVLEHVNSNMRKSFFFRRKK